MVQVFIFLKLAIGGAHSNHYSMEMWVYLIRTSWVKTSCNGIRRKQNSCYWSEMELRACTGSLVVSTVGQRNLKYVLASGRNFRACNRLLKLHITAADLQLL